MSTGLANLKAQMDIRMKALHGKSQKNSKSDSDEDEDNEDESEDESD